MYEISPVVTSSGTFYFRLIEDPVKFLDTRETVYRHRKGAYHQRHGFRERCGLTGQVLDPQDGVYLIINQTLLPNRSVSKKLTDQLGFEEAVKKLICNWEMAQRSFEVHGHWF